MKLITRLLPAIFLIMLIGSSEMAIAQTRKDTPATELKKPLDSIDLPSITDSAHINTVKEIIKQRFEDSAINESDTIVPILVKKIQYISELIANTNRISAKEFDTTKILRTLPLTEELLGIIELSFISRNAYQNLRALKSIKGILVQSEMQLETWQNSLFSYADELATLKVKLAEVKKDTVLKKLPKDSVLRDIYFSQIAGLLISWKQADSAINTSILQIAVLENRVAANFLKTRKFLDKTNTLLSIYIEHLWVPEDPSIFTAHKGDYDAEFGEALTDSMVTIGRLVTYFAQINISFLITALVIMLALYWWLLRIINKLKQKELYSEDIIGNSKLLLQYPFLAVAGLVLVFISLFFFNLPPSWNSLVWTLIAIIFFILSRLDKKAKKLYRPEFLILFLAFNTLSVLVKNSLGERWLQFLLGAAALAQAIYFIRLLLKKNSEYASTTIRIFFVYTIFLAGAFITNSYGSFMMAKILNNGAAFAIVTGIVLFISLEIIIKIILLHDIAFKENRFISYLNLHTIEQNIRKLLRLALIAAWILIMLQQLNLFEYVYEWIAGFLTKRRKLGAHSFAFGSILIFLLVIWFSVLLSRILVIFFGGSTSKVSTKKKWVGSFVILLRLGILSIGILIAFLASGIPLDKITLIIGALGVGIGFGLQNIVHNLVSGVILAFDRPVQVGDAIEVGNRYGVIKEIGIRSSKIVTVEGSEVIVPNGDMLSQHIVNWTLSSHYRRVEVVVGVSYNTDLRLAENLLKEIITAQNGVEISPPPVVLAHNFGASSVDFRLLFWCHIDTWLGVKSEVMMNIHKAFGDHNIEIPFPQQDIHIKTAETLFENTKKDDTSSNT